IVIDGIIVGTWRRTLRKDEVQIAMDLFMRLPGEQLEAVAAQAERYGRFLGKKRVGVSETVSSPDVSEEPAFSGVPSGVGSQAPDTRVGVRSLNEIEKF